ncbi:hypothetical protein [Oceanibaculum pacificum]|uniref:Uncharacterized protein n=1 Tax=Oceanibaculum pacificum TaxID=580166 RepID=A0A154VWV9_9PROT|nr:hypothetical protein [Oceanibaculum pacificum]KZD05814.1 hypothetical protein AUP43_02560 [Oceanibaculum pacificum]
MAAHRSFLDRPAARALAGCVFIGAFGLLGFLYRDMIFGPSAAAVAAANADDPFARCFAERAGQIDQMVKDGMVKPEQAEQFKGRAEAMCRAQTKDGAGGPPGGAPGMRPPPGFGPPPK